MIVRRLCCLLLIVSLCSAALPAGERRVLATNPSVPCVQLAWYAGEMRAAGETIDAQEASGPDLENVDQWTADDYDAAIALYDSFLATLNAIDPPPIATEFHQSLIDGIALFHDALETMKTSGPFAFLAYLDQFDQLNKQTGALALPLEEECGIALFDNDGDGEPEIGSGLATPESEPDTAPAEATPIATRDGRPIVPIGTTVQTSDAFSLTIVSVDQNATDAVPESPPDGYQYVNVEIKLGHLRDQTDTFDLISLIAVGAGGASYSAVGNSCGFVDGPLAPGDYTGTLTMTGHVCFVVASRDVSGLILYDQTQPPEERVYLSLDPAMGRAS